MQGSLLYSKGGEEWHWSLEECGAVLLESAKAGLGGCEH